MRTEGSGTRYDGRVWYELLSCISSVNGKPVDRSRSLEKSVLHQGDQVTMEYQNRTYHGVVDMPSDSESEGQESHSTSPLHMPLSLEMRAGVHLSCKPELPRPDERQESPPRAEVEQLTPKVDERRSPRKRRPSQLLPEASPRKKQKTTPPKKKQCQKRWLLKKQVSEPNCRIQPMLMHTKPNYLLIDLMCSSIHCGIIIIILMGS